MRRILMGLAAIAMGLGATLAVSGTASAASGTVVFKTGGKIIVQAATGFNNNISVRRDGGTIFVKDTSDVLIAAANCSSVGNEVACSANGVTVVEISAFDGADSVQSSITNMATEIHGGEGADFLFGSSFAHNRIFGDGGADLIAGGDFIDTLQGGGGNDNILGFAGNDALFGDGGVDTLHGGGGNSDLCVGETETGCEV